VPTARRRSRVRIHIQLALVTTLVASLGACERGEGVDAWCRSFESATTAFLDVYERVPEGTDPAQAFAEDPELAADAAAAGRKMQQLMALDPPDPIAEDFRYLTTTIPPDPSQSNTQEQRRYENALEDVKTFVARECDVDPALLDQLNQAA
jgi:hypothetical protein